MEQDRPENIADMGGARPEPPTDVSPAWERLWPPREGPPAWAPPEPASKRQERLQAPISPSPDGPDVHGLEERVELKLAHLAQVVKAQHANLIQQTASDLDAVRAVIRTALARANEAIQGQHAIQVQHAELAARSYEDLTALRSQLGQRMETMANRAVEAASEAIRSSVAADAVQSALDRLRPEVDAIVSRSIAEAAEGIAEASAVRQAETETRLRSELNAAISETRAAIAQAVEAQESRLDRLTEELSSSARDDREAVEGRLRSELARLRKQLVSSEAKLERRLDPLAKSASEASSVIGDLVSAVKADSTKITALRRDLRKESARISKSVESREEETVTRADLAGLKVELEAFMADELASARLELDSRMTMFDEVIEAVDAAVAGLDAARAEAQARPVANSESGDDIPARAKPGRPPRPRRPSA